MLTGRLGGAGGGPSTRICVCSVLCTGGGHEAQTIWQLAWLAPLVRAHLTCLLDGCPDAWLHDFVALLGLDVNSKEVLLEGLVLHGSTNTTHKRECVNTVNL